MVAFITASSEMLDDVVTISVAFYFTMTFFTDPSEYFTMLRPF